MNRNNCMQTNYSVWYFLQLYFLPICVILISMVLYVNLFYFICIKENIIYDVESKDEIEYYEVYI